ncbi:MAG: apolipoprotein N-acyltransferase [Candidatus Zixiibacteriota bacterium]|nr:MAG: apolipoprotein N-acyltransferase [candidate division Zixibacteria bacterium]
MRKRRLELMIWAFLLSLAFYPGIFGFLAWLSLVRPMLIIAKLKGRSAFNAAYFFSLFFNLFSLYWVAMVTPPGMIAAIMIVAFYYTAIFMIFHRLYHIRPFLAFVAMPFLWVGMEYFRTLTEFAFPWSDLGYTQSHFLYILQIVSVFSVHGLSFLIVTVNVLLCQLLRGSVSPERKITSSFVSLAIIGGLVAYGWIVMPPYPVPGTVNVALLQGSVPLEVKWAKGNAEHSYHLYDSLVQAVDDSTIDLYIWPETSAPAYLSHDSFARKRVGDIVRASSAPHLIGALSATRVGGKHRYHNSCYQFDLSGQIVHRHDKLKLVPFSEHVPYQDYLPFLEKGALRKYLTFIDNWGVRWWSDFYPGDSATLFELDSLLYGALICFECTFPEFVRQSILDGADFMVGITNDTWFGRSVGIHQHSSIFITRAVENRCWMARTANSGLTYIVDRYGRIRDQLEPYEVATLVGRIGVLDGFSTYTRIGDIVGKFSFLLTSIIGCIFIILCLVKKLLVRIRWL